MRRASTVRLLYTSDDFSLMSVSRYEEHIGKGRHHRLMYSNLWSVVDKSKRSKDESIRVWLRIELSSSWPWQEKGEIMER